MTGSAAALAMPGSRTLAGWWRQLAALQPQALWLGELRFHRAEALAALVRPAVLEPFSLAVLQGVSVWAGRPLEELGSRLALDRQVLGRLLHALRRHELVEQDAHGGWRLTPLGRRAVEAREYPRRVHERRTFTFVEPAEPGRLPHFLPLQIDKSGTSTAAADWPFDPAWLRTCVQQSAEWKQRFGFPAEIEDILVPSAVPVSEPNGRWEGVANWHAVIVNWTERLPLMVACLGPPEKSRLIGYAVRVDGWHLHTAEPVFTLTDHWHEVFPDLAAEPSPASWQRAWNAWCQPRGLTPEEAPLAAVERRGTQLHLTLPRRTVDRLRSLRSDALKGESWLLAGEGRFRMAAQLVIKEGNSPADSA